MSNKSIYLVAKYTSHPKDPTQTHKPGYINNPDNMEFQEQLYITRGLRDKDTQNDVVLNLTEEKIVKNTFNSGATFEEILSHYVDGYADYINDSVDKLNEAIQTK